MANCIKCGGNDNLDNGECSACKDVRVPKFNNLCKSLANDITRVKNLRLGPAKEYTDKEGYYDIQEEY